MKYSHYAQIRNRYCIAYGGHCAEYLVQLRLLQPILDKEFPGMDIYLAARKDFLHLLKGVDHVLPYAEAKQKRKEFGYVRELAVGKKHPILQLLEESNIVPGLDIPAPPNSNRLCVLSTQGTHPTRSMTESQIAECSANAAYAGYEVWVDPKIGAVSSAGWVVGVENEMLFEAAGQGIKTSLVPNGIGTKLYTLMFPQGEVLRNVTR